MPYSSASPDAFMALGMQSAKGTPQVTATKLRYMKYLSGMDFEVIPEVVDLREGGDGLDFGYSYKKSQKSAGQIVLNARPEVIGAVLGVVMGGATMGIAGTIPASHLFHAGHASYPWVTLLAQHPGSAIQHFLTDVRFTGFTLEGVSGEPLKLTAPYIALNHGASFAPLVPTYFAEEPFIYHTNPSYVIDGSADLTLTGFKFEQGLGVEELQSQSVTLDEAVVQNREIDVELTRRFEDPALWKKVNMGAGVSPTTSVPTGAFSARAGYGASGNFYLDVIAPLLSYRGNKLTELDPDGKTVMETISGRALKAATHSLIARLANSHASGYLS